MTNIIRLLDRLADSGRISGYLKILLKDFLKNEVLPLQTQKDVSESDVDDIIDSVSAVRFGAGLQLSDSGIDAIYKSRLSVLLCKVSVSAPLKGTGDDTDRAYVVFVEICRKFRFSADNKRAFN